MKLTKTQAIENLYNIIKFGGLMMSAEYVESVRMATEAYEQEPCEDAISRQAVIEITAETGALETQCRVMNLPPVQPKSKWIPVGKKLPEEVGNYLTSIRHYGEERFVQVSFFDGISFKAEVEAWMPLPNPYRSEGECEK